MKGEWLKNKLNVNVATSSDCYECELTSVLVVLQAFVWGHIFKTCLTSYGNRSGTGLIRLQISDVSFESYTGCK